MSGVSDGLRTEDTIERHHALLTLALRRPGASGPVRRSRRWRRRAWTRALHRYHRDNHQLQLDHRFIRSDNSNLCFDQLVIHSISLAYSVTLLNLRKATSSTL